MPKESDVVTEAIAEIRRLLGLVVHRSGIFPLYFPFHFSFFIFPEKGVECSQWIPNRELRPR